MLTPEIRELQADALTNARRVLETAVKDERRLTIAIAVSQLANDAVQPEVAHLAVATVPTSRQKGFVIAAQGSITRQEKDAMFSLETMGYGALAEAALGRLTPEQQKRRIGFASDQMVDDVTKAFRLFHGSTLLANAVAIVSIGGSELHGHDIADATSLLVKHAPDQARSYKWLAERNIPVQLLKPKEQVALFRQTGDTTFLNLAIMTAKEKISYEHRVNPFALQRIMQNARPVYAGLLRAGYPEQAEQLAAHVATHVESMHTEVGRMEAESTKRQRGEQFYDELTQEMPERHDGTAPTHTVDVEPVTHIMKVKNPVTREHMLVETYKRLGDIVAAEHVDEPTVPVAPKAPVKQAHNETRHKTPKRRFGLFSKR